MEASKNELKNASIEKASLGDKLEQTVQEMETLKMKQALEELKCKVCAISFKSSVTLTEHIRENHFKDQVCQTRKPVANANIQTNDKEIICEYPCYYCDYVIASFEDLMNHKTDCPVLDNCDDKCDQCEAAFNQRTDLINHYKNIHPEITINWCDFCQAGFDKIEELQCHIRIEHRNYLPG